MVLANRQAINVRVVTVEPLLVGAANVKLAHVIQTEPKEGTVPSTGPLDTTTTTRLICLMGAEPWAVNRSYGLSFPFWALRYVPSHPQRTVCNC